MNQAAAKKIPKNSQAQPGDPCKATGPMSRALLTPRALMGAAMTVGFRQMPARRIGRRAGSSASGRRGNMSCRRVVLASGSSHNGGESMVSSERLLGDPVEDSKDIGPHVSQVLPPLLAAFTLPTIAVIVTTPKLPHWVNIVLSLFVASTGLLLASFLLGTGRLFVDRTGWGAFRAFLAFMGLTFLAVGLGFLVWPWHGGLQPGYNHLIYWGLLVLALGIFFPMVANLSLLINQVISSCRAKRKLKKVHDFSPENLHILFKTTTFGHECALKLMEDHAHAANIDCIFESICGSVPSSEQKQALRAAMKILPLLDYSDQAKLSLAVQILGALNN